MRTPFVTVSSKDTSQTLLIIFDPMVSGLERFHCIYHVRQMFTRAKKGLQGISNQARNGSEQEKRVAKNVTSSLALSLQDLSVNFRKSQSTYLKSESPRVMGLFGAR